ncbi:MAG TPA: C-GCAxxG-C-C family protein [Bacteroidales bacterium]|nr:C-GCAxxG-C-C family protein [Bacteroidales bacterium]HQK37284.1 C-GCAxxG-C-C family protein [Bacteroidales bacterium]
MEQQISHTRKALDLFRNKYNCAQSVLTAFSDTTGLPDDVCLRLSCAFGSGMGRKQYTCGAVTGALMVLGLIYGKGINEGEEKKKHTYQKARLFIEEFEREYGSVSCRNLLQGLDMSNPDDMNKIKQLGLFEKLCEQYVSTAVRLTEKYLS